MITMVVYIKDIIRDFPEEITGTKTSPAADNLFTVRYPSLAKALPEEQAMAFHQATAQLLFLSRRAQRDIQPATAILTTRVRFPDKDNWGKVKMVLSYLKGTLHMPLILLADLLMLSRWWVDVAYAVQDDCWVHTGAGMSFGQRMALSYSWKQKIKTKSSTEDELVGVDDSLGYILWACYFLQKLSYDMDPSLLYQEKKSAILLKTNGRVSSSKHTKHIKVKYFLIKDKVDWDKITIEHFPINQMWMDIKTEPKQGTVFWVFRGLVMGIPADYNDESFVTRSNFRPPNWVSEPLLMLPIPTDQVATQECVGDNAKSPRLADARPSEKGGFAAKVTACNIQDIPGHAAKVAARKMQEIPGGNTQEIPGHAAKVAARNIQEIPGGNIQEISGYQSRVTYKEYLHQVDVRTLPVGQNRPAPIKMVSGRAWSPEIYRALRLLDKSLDVAWERAIIRPLTFN